jgi:hypothetical protein
MMLFRNSAIASLLLITTVACSAFNTNTKATSQPPDQAVTQATQFKVKIENISAKDEFTATNGTKWSLGFSPGVWLVQDKADLLFTPGQRDRGEGIEAQAEDGKPDKLAQSLKNKAGVLSSGVFNTPVGTLKPGPIRPGESYEFTVSAKPGQQLSFTTMFGQSNDWFYEPDGKGIALFDAQGKPVQGDVTSQIKLWNAGTEVDEEPGIGSNQGPRQKADNTGPVENGVVQGVQSEFAYPATEKVMRVVITPAG